MADPNFTVPDGNEIDRGNDIKPEKRIKLGQYLSSRTSANNNDSDSFVPGDYRYSPPRPNTFPISDVTSDSGPTVLNDRFGIQEATTNNQPAFVSNTDAINRWNSRATEKTGWKTVTPISAPNEQAKARALHEIEATTRVGNVSAKNTYSVNMQEGISEVLKTNAYTQDRDFRSRGQAPDREEWPAPDSNETIKRMRKEALRVLEYAAGLDKGSGFLLSNALNATPESVKRGTESLRLQGSERNVSSFDPGVKGEATQDFYGISSQYIAIGKATNTTPDDGLGDTGGVYTGITYGTKNSAQIPYGNIAKGAETILFALAAAVAIGVAILVWSAVMTIFFRKLDRPDYRTGSSPPGSERDSSVLSDLLGLLFGTKRPYNISTFEAGFVGTTSFLGINIGGGAGVGGAIADAAINFAFSPDYYTMICRMVLNGVYSFGYQAGSGASGAAGAIAALSTLRENKLVAFVNRMIDIGSITTRGVEKTTDIDPVQASTDPNSGKRSTLKDNYLERSVRRVSRSREEGNRLSWRTSSSAMALLMPSSFVNGSATMSQKNDAAGVTAWADRIGKGVPYASKDGTVTNDVGYIDTEYADEVERALNAEYVPFYFRDLRTNEIISFHAFLEDLSDSFAASYTAVEGFGRQDPVQIYKGTTRSIGLSFSVVSTSPKDHDVMWYKINRLIAMLYPQYSDGISVQDSSKNKFDVPFSQVYSASPLIRMRIGDVISSNYSRFGLSRLFGLGKKDRVFHSPGDSPLSQGSLSLDGKNKSTKDELEKILKSSTKTSADAQDAVSTMKADESLPAIPQGLSAKIIRGGVFMGSSEILGDTHQVQVRPGTQVRIGDISISPFARACLLPGDRASGNSNVAFAMLEKPITVKVRTSLGGEDSIDIAYLYVPHELLEYKSGFPLAGIPDIIVTNASDSVTKTKEFFNPSTNSIVRSFESSMGRGLAGVITSLSMDWNEATWETDRPGSKAPIWLKITLQFAPIHDLPMGLDSDGAMTAPAYPIGPVVRESHLIDIPAGSGVPNAGFSAKSDGSYTTNYNADATPESIPQRYTKRFI